MHRSLMDSGFLPIDDRHNELVWLRLSRAVVSVFSVVDLSKQTEECS